MVELPRWRSPLKLRRVSPNEQARDAAVARAEAQTTRYQNRLDKAVSQIGQLQAELEEAALKTTRLETELEKASAECATADDQAAAARIDADAAQRDAAHVRHCLAGAYALLHGEDGKLLPAGSSVEVAAIYGVLFGGAPPTAEPAAPVDLGGEVVAALDSGAALHGSDRTWVDGWSVVARAVTPDLSGQHVVLRRRDGSHYAVPLDVWASARPRTQLTLSPVRVSVKAVTTYQVLDSQGTQRQELEATHG